MHDMKFAKQTKLGVPRLEVRVYLAEGVDQAANVPSDEQIYECALVWEPPRGTGLPKTIVHLDRMSRPLSRVEAGGLMFQVAEQISKAHCQEETAAAFQKDISTIPTWN